MQEVLKIEFNKTDCGVPFLINSAQADFLGAYLDGRRTYTTDFFEIYFFPEDTGMIWVNDESLPLRAGSILFLSPSDRRRWQIEHRNFSFLVFVEDFLSGFMADKLFVHRLPYFLQYTYPLSLCLEHEAFVHVERVLGEMQGELRHINRDTEPLLTALLHYLLLHLARLYSRAYALPEVHHQGTIPYQFKQLVEQHIAREHAVSFYATRLGVTRARLDEALRVIYGMTASQIIRRRLLVELKAALLHEDKAIKEVAYELGFSEPQHMMRFFKSMTGQTIGQWLELCKNGSIPLDNGSS